ncbi:gluconokinase [Bombiscardovia nodaiensis]|uniref:Gluconokinase n=1 Tax=Bombiscardovia nodaiensis TaxID=2932181 RepID=A0ABN6SAB8_9BIFI|nr:gluconokinase [Bombiscardovia nodaiensis]
MSETAAPSSGRHLPQGYFTGTTPILVVMGVSGCGKTTLSQLLAKRLGWELAEGDDFHSQANINKMSHGIPLTDQDRWPWLDRIRSWIDDHKQAGKPAIVTCSALKRSYRSKLTVPGLAFVYLEGDYNTILARMQARKGHYMKPDMLRSQFDTLEPPTPPEPYIDVDISSSTSPESTCATALELLGLSK